MRRMAVGVTPPPRTTAPDGLARRARRPPGRLTARKQVNPRPGVADRGPATGKCQPAQAHRPHCPRAGIYWSGVPTPQRSRPRGVHPGLPDDSPFMNTLYTLQSPLWTLHGQFCALHIHNSALHRHFRTTWRFRGRATLVVTRQRLRAGPGARLPRTEAGGRTARRCTPRPG